MRNKFNSKRKEILSPLVAMKNDSFLLELSSQFLTLFSRNNPLSLSIHFIILFSTLVSFKAVILCGGKLLGYSIIHGELNHFQSLTCQSGQKLRKPLKGMAVRKKKQIRIVPVSADGRADQFEIKDKHLLSLIANPLLLRQMVQFVILIIILLKCLEAF